MKLRQAKKVLKRFEHCGFYISVQTINRAFSRVNKGDKFVSRTSWHSMITRYIKSMRTAKAALDAILGH